MALAQVLGRVVVGLRGSLGRPSVSQLRYLSITRALEALMTPSPLDMSLLSCVQQGKVTQQPAAGRTFASSSSSGEEEAGDVEQATKQEEKVKGDDVIYPRNYEEVEDELYDMVEDLLPNIHKPLYNVWDKLPEDERDVIQWDEKNSKERGSIGDMLSDLYDDEQWDMDEEITQAEETVGQAGSDHALERVSDWEDTIFQWEYYLVLHPQAVALPRHPKNDKVRLTVQLENLRSYYGLSEAQKSHIALICGPRYKSKSDSILLTTQTHQSRADNQRHLMNVVKELVEEAKSFVPS
ncbi:hypothetical protein HOP50_15g74140 [Chloropicon primus]|uniref:Small ribosomal subunit protein mS35 mitochondrial conserved domain-containing protein n=1 Tax=Chloropicon primus TaxID=1764295 RepID=A0A5B8MX38_9CHLO|nr:hypothetical protein A3770_15p73890 [Chloropicon primus]UPR04081.1 hypothetical protein HOP50_15g74140 [Chloropicon primus]|eukprot:QDZ24871.1 hypothetical protein A3770_15p73890 [Chloropicon primus]